MTPTNDQIEAIKALYMGTPWLPSCSERILRALAVVHAREDNSHVPLVDFLAEHNFGGARRLAFDILEAEEARGREQPLREPDPGRIAKSSADAIADLQRHRANGGTIVE